MKFIILTMIFSLPPPTFAYEFKGLERSALTGSMQEVQSVGGKLTAPCPTCATNPPVLNYNSEAWITLTPTDAQCTPGATAAGHQAKIRVSAFGQGSSLSIEMFSVPKDGAVRNARQIYPYATYIGNGPIFMEGGQPNGYVKSGGKTLSPIDCVNFRSNPGNLGKQNSVFVKYHPRKSPPETGNQTTWKYRVVSTEFLCKQLQPATYVSWLQRTRSDDVQAYLKSSKRWESDGEDLVQSDQIDFAIQSGPAVLRDGQELLADYNSGTGYRSYIGVSSDGDPLVVEADGNIGSYCLGRYVKALGVQDLLHRDSSISDANFRENDGQVTGYPTINPSAHAASLFVISP